jgi:transposase
MPFGATSSGLNMPTPDGRITPTPDKSITNWVAHAAIDSGKPLPGKDGLRSVEREELARLRRENRRLQMERDILAKATAWFAARGEKTSTPSSNS